MSERPGPDPLFWRGLAFASLIVGFFYALGALAWMAL